MIKKSNEIYNNNNNNFHDFNLDISLGNFLNQNFTFQKGSKNLSPFNAKSF